MPSAPPTLRHISLLCRFVPALQAIATAVSDATGQSVTPQQLQQGQTGAVSGAITQGTGSECMGGWVSTAGDSVGTAALHSPTVSLSFKITGQPPPPQPPQP